eukprot:scaffold16803_cov122-Isochrysis_galbana.AAC.4
MAPPCFEHAIRVGGDAAGCHIDTLMAFVHPLGHSSVRHSGLHDCVWREVIPVCLDDSRTYRQILAADRSSPNSSP